MARLVKLQGETDSLVEYERNSSRMSAVLIIVAVSSLWTIQPNETHQVGEMHLVMRLGSQKSCLTDFRQREHMYLHVSQNPPKPHQWTLYTTLR